jgi:hypothetical protein
MLRVLFLVLMLMSSVAFAQTDEKPKAIKFDEFETATNGFVKMKLDAFYAELGNNPNSQGYIINYGINKEIALRERQIRDSIIWRKNDVSRVSIVRGGFWKNVKTEFWVVPPGADHPRPASTAEMIDEFEKIPDGDLKMRLERLYLLLAKSPVSKGYIIITGSAKVMALQEYRIKKLLGFLKLDGARATFKQDGTDKTDRTLFWIIPTDERIKQLQTK